MKKLTGALVLSLSLLLLSGCRSAGETKDAEDASTPSNSAQSPSRSGIINAAREIAHRDAGPIKGDGGRELASESESESDEGTHAGMASADGASSVTLSDAERKAQESCLDAWLKNKKLDRYGNAEGTMYTGGTPLFDERTGESRDRLDFVYQRQPEARKACATPGKTPAPK
jgi:hypothetical protein